jgi:hypothetical protein
MPHIGDCLDISCRRAARADRRHLSVRDQAAWMGQAGIMDGDLDMTHVNSAMRNPVSLGANARNRARAGIASRPGKQLRARSSPDHA